MEWEESIDSLIKECEANKIDLWIQSIVHDLIIENQNEQINSDEEINFKAEKQMLKILDFIEDNEQLMAHDIVYWDLNSDIREVVAFISWYEDEFTKWPLYANFYANYIWKITKHETIFLSEFRTVYMNKLSNRWVQITDKEFYLNVKNNIRNFINWLNSNFIKKINTVEKYVDPILDSIEQEIDYNDYILWIMTDLIDFMSTNKGVVLGDIIGWDTLIWNYLDDLLEIKYFLENNEWHVSIEIERSVYFDQFLNILNLIDQKSTLTIEELEKQLAEKWNFIEDDDVIINDAYYNEVKAELLDFMNWLNSLLEIQKTT